MHNKTLSRRLAETYDLQKKMIRELKMKLENELPENHNITIYPEKVEITVRGDSIEGETRTLIVDKFFLSLDKTIYVYDQNYNCVEEKNIFRYLEKK